MKHLRHLFATLFLLFATSVCAHDFEVNGIYYNIISATDLTVEVTYRGGTNYEYGNEYSGEIIIPSTVSYKSKNLTVTGIGGSAFYECNGVEKITIPNTVTTIGYMAFRECTGLTTVTIGKGVTKIGGQAFYDCSKLTNFNIPNSVTEIGKYAFYGCRQLKSITIPSSVIKIDDFAFEGCGLKELKIEDGEKLLTLGCNEVTESYEVPNGKGLFDGLLLETLYMGRNLSYKSDGHHGYSPFSRLSSLTSVTIGDSVTSIGKNMFMSCYSLEHIVIGKNVAVIEDGAMNYCDNIASIYLTGIVPPTVNKHNFENVNYSNAILYVPQGTLSQYQTADVWKDFWDIQEYNAEEKKCAQPTINYKNGELQISCDTEGAVFVTNITDNDITTHYTNKIQLTVSYEISTYATAIGYKDSDIITTTLCWIECDDDVSNLTQIKSTPILIKSNDGKVIINGAKNGTQIDVYDINGYNLGTIVANGNEVVINTTLSKNDIAIIRIGKKCLKIVIR